MLVVAASSETVAVSAIATGASFTGVTVTVNVPVAVSIPSVTVYVITSVPLKSADGV